MSLYCNNLSLEQTSLRKHHVLNEDVEFSFNCLISSKTNKKMTVVALWDKLQPIVNYSNLHCGSSTYDQHSDSSFSRRTISIQCKATAAYA